MTGVTSLSVTGPTFWPVGRLHTPRVGHTATLLPNGKVLIVGGQDVNLKLIASAELYDPATGTFSLTGSTVARAYHTATLLPSGKVLIAGGTVGDGSSTSNEADLYDPATGTFALAAFMKNYQSFHSATLLNNGLVLIAGGHYVISGGGGGFSDNELYDPTANTFTTTGNFITSRYSETATLLNDGSVLVAGGFGTSGSYLASAELFIPSTGMFSATGNLSTAKLGHTATLLNSGRTLITGGTAGGTTSFLNVTEIYDPVAKTFVTAGNVTTKRSSHSAVRLNGGSVLVIGGQNSIEDTGTAELFDPVSQVFLGAGSLVTARAGHTATLLNDGTVLVVGGENITLIPEAEVYALTRPLASPLQVTPASAGMQVGDARQFTAVDNNGNPRADVTWTVSDATLAAVTAESSTTLTALAAGTVTLTATASTVVAHAQVTISAAGTITPGTALWSAPAVPGYTPLQLVQAVPNQTGADLYSVLSTSDHSQAVIQSLTVDGQQLAQTSLPAVNASSVPDAFGGVLITQYSTCDNINPVSITDLDPVTMQPVWVLTGQSKCAPLPPQIAIRSDGSTIVSSSGNTAGFPELMILDSRGLQRLGAAVPTSSYTDAFGTTLAGFSPIGAPIVDSEGYTYVEFEVRNISAFNRGSNPPTVSSVLWLWKIAPNNIAITATQLSSSSNANLFPGNIIPDGSGGVVATWTIAWAGDVTVPKPAHPYQGAHMSSTGTIVTYDMPMAPTQLVIDPISGLPVNPPLVLGENGTAFVCYGTNITSLDLNVGSANWNYPAVAQTTLSIIASAAANGLVAKSTAQNGIDTVLRFDSSGAVTVDTWTASKIDYWAGNLWSGVSLSSGNVTEYSSPLINFSTSWFAPDMNGTKEAVQDLFVTNASSSDPNQAVIVSVFGKIKAALDTDAASPKPTCSNWLKGTGTTGSQAIQLLLEGSDPLHPVNNFGHGIFNITGIAAVTGGRNADNTLIGVPANFSITLNDGGAFFNSTDSAGRLFTTGRRQYPGNTLKAQSTILIHELGHVLSVAEFQADAGIPKAGKANDKLVDQNCRYLIEGLQ